MTQARIEERTYRRPSSLIDEVFLVGEIVDEDLPALSQQEIERLYQSPQIAHFQANSPEIAIEIERTDLDTDNHKALAFSERVATLLETDLKYFDILFRAVAHRVQRLAKDHPEIDNVLEIVDTASSSDLVFGSIVQLLTFDRLIDGEHAIDAEIAPTLYEMRTDAIQGVREALIRIYSCLELQSPNVAKTLARVNPRQLQTLLEYLTRANEISNPKKDLDSEVIQQAKKTGGGLSATVFGWEKPLTIEGANLIATLFSSSRMQHLIEAGVIKNSTHRAQLDMIKSRFNGVDSLAVAGENARVLRTDSVLAELFSTVWYDGSSITTSLPSTLLILEAHIARLCLEQKKPKKTPSQKAALKMCIAEAQAVLKKLPEIVLTNLQMDSNPSRIILQRNRLAFIQQSHLEETWLMAHPYATNSPPDIDSTDIPTYLLQALYHGTTLAGVLEKIETEEVLSVTDQNRLLEIIGWNVARDEKDRLFNAQEPRSIQGFFHDLALAYNNLGALASYNRGKLFSADQELEIQAAFAKMLSISLIEGIASRDIPEVKGKSTDEPKLDQREVDEFARAVAKKLGFTYKDGDDTRGKENSLKLQQQSPQAVLPALAPWLLAAKQASYINPQAHQPPSIDQIIHDFEDREILSPQSIYDRLVDNFPGQSEQALWDFATQLFSIGFKPSNYDGSDRRGVSRSVCLIGPSGAAKTSLAEYGAKVLEQLTEQYVISLKIHAAQQAPESYVGATGFSKGISVGILTAMREKFGLTDPKEAINQFRKMVKRKQIILIIVADELINAIVPPNRDRDSMWKAYALANEEMALTDRNHPYPAIFTYKDNLGQEHTETVDCFPSVFSTGSLTQVFANLAEYLKNTRGIDEENPFEGQDVNDLLEFVLRESHIPQDLINRITGAVAVAIPDAQSLLEAFAKEGNQCEILFADLLEYLETNCHIYLDAIEFDSDANHDFLRFINKNKKQGFGVLNSIYLRLFSALADWIPENLEQCLTQRNGKSVATIPASTIKAYLNGGFGMNGKHDSKK